MRASDFDPLSHIGPLPSPCISLCQMDASSGLCKGCLRTLDEIMDWGVAPEAKKRQIWISILERRASN